MKKKNITLIIFIFIAVLSVIIIKPINDLDEIWNYNNARVVSEGLIPYKDISMITTPLLPIITAVFLKLIANEIIVSRILAVFLWTGVLFTIYKIMIKLLKEENICLIITASIGILCKDIFCIDYNCMVLLMTLIIVYIELRWIEERKNNNILDNSEKTKKQDFIIGLLAGLAICTKHSIGMTLAIVVVIYKLLFVENKEQFKQYLESLKYRIIGIFAPIAGLLIYLIITGSTKDFINYAILGIRSFSNNIPYISLFNNSSILIKILSIAIPISIFISAIILIIIKLTKGKELNTEIQNTKNEYEESYNILTLFIYSLSIIIVIYPIADKIHFLIGSMIALININYLIYLVLIRIYRKINIKTKNRIYKTITLFIWLLLFVPIATTSIESLYSYTRIEKNNEISHYKNIEIWENLKNRIQNIDAYILKQERLGKKVYILDAEAAIYMIPMDQYNKDYDMFLKGNIGKDGEDGQIEKIKSKDTNELYLVRRKNLKTNWQTPLKVVEYVRNNLEKIGEIDVYEIYK